MIKLLIFDLDGTLVNTSPAIHEALTQVLKAQGYSKTLPYDVVRTALKTTLGGDSLVSAGYFKSVNEWEALKDDFYQRYSQIYLNEITVFKGLIDFLDQWTGSLAIASNKLEFFVKGLIENSVFNRYKWAVLTGGDSFPQKKPDPCQLLYILEKTKTVSQEAVMIGDSLADMQAAQRAGVHKILVCFDGEPLSFPQAQVITHYNQLSSQIEGFLSL